MKFATIIRESGIHAPFFSKCSEIPVVLYNEKDHIFEANDVKFVKPLFEENPESRERFSELVDYLDANYSDYTSINVQVTASHVVVFHKTPNATLFRRTPPTIDFD